MQKIYLLTSKLLIIFLTLVHVKISVTFWLVSCSLLMQVRVVISIWFILSISD